MTRVLIADDHAVVREGLKQLLAESLPHVEFVEAAAIPETLEFLRKEQWNLLLLDLFMPGGSGLTVLDEVRLSHPKVPILVISCVPEEVMGLRVLRSGASGYLDKQAAARNLVQAVCKVLEGGTYLSGTMGERLASTACRNNVPLHEKLSGREYQVLHLVAGGQCLKEIAEGLFLSVKTVRAFHAAC
jgi:two-component system, NarL family, invasion response regulator UvrY